MSPETENGMGLPFAEAIDFFAQKVNVATTGWTDIWEAAHARAFSVAGATSEALLQDFRGAIQKALKDGTTLAEFRKDFDNIVEKHGWQHYGTPGWRARVIYETNLNMAFAAGRFKQMTHPDTLAVFPFWTYRHSGNTHFRPQHKAWDGLTLKATDSFWLTNYPPNGFHCGCWVEPQMGADLRRMGKRGPDASPPINMETRLLKTGEVVRTPNGVDPGFGYNVGEAWLRPTGTGRFVATGMVPPVPPLPVRHDPVLTDDDMTDLYRPWRISLSKAEREAIGAYRGPYGHPVNDALRAGVDHPILQPLSDTLSSALERASAPCALLLHRGIENSSWLDSLPIGARFVDPGFFSTSIRRKAARPFAPAGGAMMEVEVPKGAKAAYIAHIPETGKMEYEVLLQRGTAFEVVSRKGGITRVRVVRHHDDE